LPKFKETRGALRIATMFNALDNGYSKVMKGLGAFFKLADVKEALRPTPTFQIERLSPIIKLRPKVCVYVDAF
jgi:hypothetical protein